VLDESHQPRVVERSEEIPEIGVEHPVHLPLLDRLVQGYQRLMGIASWPCAVREAGELGLVHGVEYRHGRPLDDLVLHRRYADRPLLAIPFWDVHPSHRLRAVRTSPHPIRQLGQVRLQILAVVFPRLAIDAWYRITFQLVERRPERVDSVDVVQQRCEPCSFLLFGYLPYPPQRRVHARPALRPVRGGLWRVPLGQPPSLRSLRSPSPSVVRHLPRYYAAV
jgi:hypothetical protein